MCVEGKVCVFVEGKVCVLRGGGVKLCSLDMCYHAAGHTCLSCVCHVSVM